MLVDRLLSQWVYQDEVESPEDSAGAAVETAPEAEAPLDLEKLVNDALEELDAQDATIQPEAEEPEKPTRGADGKFKAKEPEPVEETEETPEPETTAPTAEQQSLADKYGVPVEEVQAYPDTDTAQRALEYADRQLVAAARRMTPQPQQQPTPEQSAGEQPTAPGWDELHKKLEEADVAPEVIETIKANFERNALVEQRAAKVETEFQQFKAFFEQREQKAAQERADAEVRHYLNSLDKLGHDDLFGKGNTADETQKANTRAVYDTLQVLQNQLAAAGRSTEITEGMVDRAVRITFPEQVQAKERAALAKKLKDQSRKVMGSGQRKTPQKNTPWDGPEEEDPLYRTFFESVRTGEWKPGAIKP